MKIEKWGAMAAVCLVAAFTLAGCGSSGGSSLTAITSEEDAALAANAFQGDFDSAFYDALPELPSEVSDYMDMAPKAMAPKSYADRMEAIKAKKASKANAPGTGSLTCINEGGTGETTFEALENSYEWTLTATNCEIAIAYSEDTCTLNGTSSWLDELVSTSSAGVENWKYTAKTGNGNGVAEASDLVIACTSGLATTTWTADESYSESYQEISADKGTETYSGVEKGAMTVVGPDNFDASLNYSDKYNGTYTFDNSVSGEYTSFDKESYSGSITAKADFDTTDSIVDIDFTGAGGGTDAWTYVSNATENYEDSTFNETITFSTPEEGCGSGRYNAVGDTHMDYNDGYDETGTITVNGALKIEFLDADAVKLTLNDVVIDTVTTEAALENWVIAGTGTCSLFEAPPL